jgi:hypothetical protein
VSLAKKPSTALSQDAEVGVKWNVQRGCRASHLRGIMAQTPHGALKVPRAFGMLVGHLPSAILSLPRFVSRSPPDNSCMYPSWISRSLCSAGIVRCIKPLAQSRNETNSSWVKRRRQIGAHSPNMRLRRCRSSQSPATIKLTHYRAFRLDV